MAKKTNKTSHVMDLLTNGASGDSTPASEPATPSQDAATGQEKKTDVQSHSVTPKKVTVVDEGSRNDRVSQEILNNLAQELKAEYESKLKEINKEADMILAEARKKAMIKETDILDEARAEAARIIERANRQVELERKKALDDMKQELVTIASLMAGKVVAASIDTTVQDALIDETLKEMGESTWQS